MEIVIKAAINWAFTFHSFRKMYWADWGNHPKIETAAMDGTMRETLVEENIQWPTGKTCTHASFSLVICYTKYKVKVSNLSSFC